LSFSPAAGLCTDATTAPSRKAGTFDVTVNPSASSCSRACPMVWPVMTFGSSTRSGPFERVSTIVSPGRTGSVAGVATITLSSGTSSLNSGLGRSTASPTPVRARLGVGDAACR
jgi:hypothetical protein